MEGSCPNYSTHIALQAEKQMTTEFFKKIPTPLYVYASQLYTLVCQIDVHAQLLILGVKVQPT